MFYRKYQLIITGRQEIRSLVFISKEMNKIILSLATP